MWTAIAPICPAPTIENEKKRIKRERDNEIDIKKRKLLRGRKEN